MLNYQKIEKNNTTANSAENQKIQEWLEKLSEPEAVTFEIWAEKWMETYKLGTVKRYTYMYIYETNVRKYLIPFFGTQKISEIKQADIQKYFDTVRNDDGQPLVKSMFDKQEMILRGIFDVAVSNNLCPENPVKNISCQCAQKKEPSVYTREQAESAEAYARKYNEYGVLIILKTGLRRSELLGLRWSDIDFENLWIHVRRSVVKTKGRIVINNAEMTTAERIVPISMEFAEYLKRIPNTGGYVMGKDKPLNPNTYEKNFSGFMNQMSKKINIPVLTSHQLRETFAALLRESGMDNYTIQRIMGQSDIPVTSSADVYNNIPVLRRQMGLE